MSSLFFQHSSHISIVCVRLYLPCRNIDSYLGSCCAPVISLTLPIIRDRMKEALDPTYTKLPEKNVKMN